MYEKKRSIVVGAIMAVTIALLLPGLSIAGTVGNIIIGNQISQT